MKGAAPGVAEGCRGMFVLWERAVACNQRPLAEISY